MHVSHIDAAIFRYGKVPQSFVVNTDTSIAVEFLDNDNADESDVVVFDGAEDTGDNGTLPSTPAGVRQCVRVVVD
jgi:hypothetical protein